MSLRVSIAAVLSATALAGQVPSLDLTTVPTKITPQSLVVGDFNHDGKPDLAVTGSADNGAGSVEILLNNGDATFHPAAVINVGEAASRIAAADFNRDGKLDLAVSVGFTGQVSILLGNGDGSFQAPQDSGANPTGNLDKRIPGMTVGDINGDGKPDLDGDGRNDAFLTGWSSSAVPSARQKFGRLLANADGSLALTWTNYTYQFVFGTLLTTADVNSNGKPDVVAVDYIDYPNPGRLPIVTFADNSATQVGSSADIPSDSADGMSYVSMAAADIDGDGRPDLLLTDPRGGLLVITGGGDGTFHAPAGYPVASPSPNIYTGATTVGKYDDYWGSITTADFRNSGKQDIVMALAGKSVSLLKNSSGNPPRVTSLTNSATQLTVPSRQTVSSRFTAAASPTIRARLNPTVTTERVGPP